MALPTNIIQGNAAHVTHHNTIHALMPTGESVQIKTKAGTPVDGDFTSTPANGTLAVNTSTDRVWYRKAGVWTEVTAAAISTAIQEEGSALTQRATVNFVGTGIKASDDAAGTRTKVEVSSPWVDVKLAGAVGDGVANDLAAIQAAHDSLPAGGGVVFFPPGIYTWTSTQGLSLSKSNVTWLGTSGSVIKPAAGGRVAQSAAAFYSNITFEGLTFDYSNNLLTFQVYGGATTDLHFRNCRFWKIRNQALIFSECADISVEDCLFQGDPSAAAANSGDAITMTLGCKRIAITRNKFLYLKNGIIGDTGVTTGASEDVTEFIDIEDNYFDAGWWHLPAKFARVNPSCTYSATVLTDTGASFTGITALDTIRLMPTLESGTVTTLTSLRIIDSTASFISNFVQRGDIVRAVGTPNCFGIVANVKSETEFYVEEWLSDVDRTPVTGPANGALYTVYSIWFGKISSSTATTITVPRWYRKDGVTVAAPPTGTYYEVLRERPNYPIHFEQSAQSVTVTGNKLRRGWSDQISLFGHSHIVTDNIIEDGQDTGITIQEGRFSVVANNHVYNQGAQGIAIDQAHDNVVANNMVLNTQWENTDAINPGGIMVYDGARNTISNNHVERLDAAYGHMGIIVRGSAAVDNDIIGNSCWNHLTAGIRVGNSPAAAVNTQVTHNRGTVSDSGTTTTIHP